MILSLSTWIDGHFIHDKAFDCGPADIFTPALARNALMRRFGKFNNSIVWHGKEGYRFFRNSYKNVYRQDVRADPRHYERWDSFEHFLATDTAPDFAPDRPEDFRGD